MMHILSVHIWAHKGLFRHSKITEKAQVIDLVVNNNLVHQQLLKHCIDSYLFIFFMALYSFELANMSPSYIVIMTKSLKDIFELEE